MDELFTALVKQVVTLGPIGIVGLVGWAMYLRWGPRSETRGNGKLSIVATLLRIETKIDELVSQGDRRRR